MRTSRTATLALAAALGLGSLIGMAQPALAESVDPSAPMVLSLPDTDPQPGPGDISAGDDTPDLPPPPAPVPQPRPEGPQDVEADIPLPEPHPQPDPQSGDDKVGPQGEEPECNPNLGACDITNPEPDCDPMLGSCDITNPEPEPDCDPKLGSCDLTSTPDDGGDDPVDPDEPATEDAGVDATTAGPASLPFTGSESLVLGAAGLGLIAAGTGFRRLARR